VLPSLNGGGAERAAVHIMNALDPRVWDRSMYLFRREGAYLDAVDGAIAVSAGDDSSRMARWNALRRFFLKTRPDLIVSFLSYLSVLSAAAAARTGARVIFNQQTPMSAFLTDRDLSLAATVASRACFSLASRLGYQRADAVGATSKGVAADLTEAFGVPADRIHIVHNPIDLEAIRLASTELLECTHEAAWRRPAIVAAGRLADAKNYPLMLEAFAVLRRTVPARLFILGEGERAGAMREQIAGLGLNDSGGLCGFQRNPWKYIARADVRAQLAIRRPSATCSSRRWPAACRWSRRTRPAHARSSPTVKTGCWWNITNRLNWLALSSVSHRQCALRQRMSERSKHTALRFALPPWPPPTRGFSTRCWRDVHQPPDAVAFAIPAGVVIGVVYFTVTIDRRLPRQNDRRGVAGTAGVEGDERRWPTAIRRRHTMRVLAVAGLSSSPIMHACHLAVSSATRNTSSRSIWLRNVARRHPAPWRRPDLRVRRYAAPPLCTCLRSFRH
jgi:hypothetical protein